MNGDTPNPCGLARRAKAFPIWTIAVVLGVIALTGCVQAKPSILASDVKLLRVQGPAGEFAERLSVFVFARDGDGDADFGSLELTHVETGLVWKVDRENAMVTLKGKDRWLGTNAIAGPGGGPIPSGAYTLTYSDLAGNEALKTIEIVRPDFPERAPVTFRVDGNKWYVDRNPDAGEFTRTWLYLEDGKSAILQSWKVPETGESRVEGTMESLQMMALQAVCVQCYTENVGGTSGVLLTPVDLR